MRSLEHEFSSRAQHLHESFSRRSRQNEKLGDAIKQLGIDFKATTAEVRKEAEQTRHDLKKSAHDKRRELKGLKVVPFSYQGSGDVTRIPPYDYEWTWQGSTGTAEITTSANKHTGQMKHDVYAGYSGESSQSAQTAIGIYFSPPSTSGHLLVWASPSLWARWGTFCERATAHIDAWIHLLVTSYDGINK